MMVFVVLALYLGAGNPSLESFHKAKLLLEEIYADHRTTFYCGCAYRAKDVDHQSCGYEPKNDTRRSHRTEWEHVVPAHAFGQSFIEWREGHDDCVDSKNLPFRGRRCAERINRTYRLMQADLYNLVPAIGEVNGRRSNYSMADLPGEPREFGACDVEIRDRKIEPRPEIRGDIARIYFYMEQAYPGHGIISKKNRRLFEVWSRADPVDAWECKRAQIIADLQGNRNDLLEAACTR